MKKLITLSMGLLFVLNVLAQAPQLMSYQAVIRDGSGNPVTNTVVSLRFSVRSATPAGTIVYRETQSPTTNEYGLVNLMIGNGTPDIGSISSITWGTNAHYMEVEEDFGSGFESLGTSQLLSVPYALYADETNIEIDNTLDGEGNSLSPLKLAQQGASTGDVLKWDGTTWLPAADENNNCNTLDEAYDCGNTPGPANRVINVDDGSILLSASNAHVALVVNQDPASDGISIPLVAAGDGIDINATGVGEGVKINHTNAGNGAEITHSGAGDGMDITHAGAGDGIDVVHNGTGIGIEVVQNGINDGIFVTQNGPTSAISVSHNGNSPAVDVLSNTGATGILVTSAGAGIGLDITQLVGSGKGIVLNQGAEAIGLHILQSQNSNAAVFTQTAVVTSPNVVSNGNNNAASILSNQFGTGDGIKTAIINAGNGSEALDVSTNGTGRAAVISQINFTNASAALDVTTSGLGPAATISQTHIFNMSPALVTSMSGMAPVANFQQNNLINGSPAIVADTDGLGPVIKADIVNFLNGSPTIVATTTGTGSIARFETGPPANASPTLDIMNAGSGHAAYLASTNITNPSKALMISSANAGGGLSVDGTSAATEVLSSFELAPAVGPAGKVAHFAQTNPMGFTPNEVVLISTNNTTSTTPALRVTTPGVGKLAAEFNGIVDITGAIDVIGHAFLNGGATITGDVELDGFLDVATITADAIVAGSITAPIKMFTIDHPLDPENKTLHHASIESNEIMNLYSGNVYLDAKGEAVVELPNWFDALNTDTRYQLTCIGGFANVYVKEELKDNQFVIGGGYDGLKISWQLTAIRHDKFVVEHPLVVEKDKSRK